MSSYSLCHIFSWNESFYGYIHYDLWNNYILTVNDWKQGRVILDLKNTSPLFDLKWRSLKENILMCLLGTSASSKGQY